MLGLDLPRISTLVVLGAHPDDAEIAAGATMLTLAAANPGLAVHYVLLTGSPRRRGEARVAAEAFLPGAKLTFVAHDLPDTALPSRWSDAKQAIDAVSASVAPDVVLAPSADDAHQDHRTVAKLAPTAFRDALMLHYEIPKWDGDLARRNVYVPVSDATARQKVELLQACFPSQRDRDWWDDEVFLGLARLRGMECRTRYAEAFTCHKAPLRPCGDDRAR
jgi:LmbE family N-acetylglucosaminyl deacetylase